MRNSLNNPKIALLISALVIGLCWNLALQAELVIMQGDVLRSSSIRILGQDIRVSLPESRAMTLPLPRIVRIVDREVLPQPTVVPEPPPTFALDFTPNQRVPKTPYGKLIHATAHRHDVNPALIVAMVRQESRFNAAAESPRGARGLMQLMPETAERFGLEHADLSNPASNLEAGVRYIAWLSDRFEGDLANVLAAFNSGEGTVDRYDGVPPYRETREYIQRIYADLGLDLRVE